MAKEVFKRTKPHMNVGTIGHGSWEDDVNVGDNACIGEAGVGEGEGVRFDR